MSKFKKDLQKRTEKNSVKINGLVWTDNKGKTHTEDIVLKRSTLPILGDWNRVYPLIDENGKPLWLNIIFGGKRNFIKLLFMMGIVALILLAFSEFFSNYETLRSFCEPYLQGSNLLS